MASWFLVAVTHSQIPNIGPKVLQHKVKNKTTVAAVMQEVEAFYKAKNEAEKAVSYGEKEFENEYVKWKRWEDYAKYHSGPNGTFYDVQKALWDAHEQITSNQLTSLPASPNSPHSPTTPDWIFTGPFSSSYATMPPANINGLGRCDRIAFHTSNPAIVFVGTPMGGLWKTTNYGTSWTCLTSFLPIAGVSGVVVDWSNPNIIYILTGNGDDQNITATVPGIFSSAGVFKTTDGGVNWRRVTMPWGSSTNGIAPYQIKQSPRFPNKIVVASSFGLFKSSNGGSTWSTIYTVPCTDIDFVPGTDTFYAAVLGPINQPIKRINNTTGGITNISFGAAANIPIPTVPNRISLAVTNTTVAANLELVYIFAGPVTGSRVFNGLFKTNSSGFISLKTNTPNLFDLNNDGAGGFDQSWYDNCIAVKPTDGNTFLTGGAAIFKSIDGGTTIKNSGSYSEVAARYDLLKYVHADIHDLAYNPLNNYLYVAGDGGMSYSTDDGATWANISTGLTTSMFYDIAGLESNQYAILGGLQDNGNKYRGTNSFDFTHIGAFDGYNSAISPSNTARGYYSANQFLLRTDNLGSGIGGGINPVTAAGQWHWRMNTDLLNGDFVYASTENTDSIFTSNNAGASWFRKQLGGGQREIINCPSNANRMYIIGGINFPGWSLRRTDNQGASWTTNLLTNPGLPSPLTDFASDIEVSPTNSNLVFLSFAGFTAGNKIFLSANAGADWVNITYNLPILPVLSLAVDNNDNVYAGTDYGVYVKLNSAGTWYFYANKLPRTSINDLMINRTNGLLYAATYGRGIWRTNVVNTPCSDAFYFITGNVTGERFYEAGAVWSTAVLDTMQGTRVNFKVTDSAKLLNGFIAGEGIEEFRAYTGPCGSSYPTLTNVKDTSIINISTAKLPSNEQEGNYPYGTIRINYMQNGCSIELHAKKEGSYKIRLSKANGEFVKNAYQFKNVPPGVQNIQLSLAGLPKGLYYAHLMYNDMLVHYQEVEVVEL